MQQIKFLKLATLVFCFLFLFCLKTASASAAEYYVAPTGNDSNIGSFGAPWKTLQKAENSVTAGDTIFMRGGTYALGDSFVNWNNAGTAGNPITVRNYPGETPIITGSGGNSGGIYFYTPAAYIVIDGLEITSATPYSMYGMGIFSHNATHDITIRNCYIHDIKAAQAGAIHTKRQASETGGTYNWIIENNHISNIQYVGGLETGGEHGIYISS